MKIFTEADLVACWPYHAQYLVDILNGEYPVETAREDLGSLVGTVYDPRCVTTSCPAQR